MWVKAADGSGELRAVPGSESTLSTPRSWSPDGKWLVGNGASGADIWLLSAEGSGEARALIAGPAQEMTPSFSPDGKWIAYTSDESGRMEVYVSRFPITGQRWMLSEHGGVLPVWSPDGHELYFWAVRRLMVVAINYESECQPSRARKLLDVDLAQVISMDVFPDGNRFVLIGRGRASQEAPAPVLGISRSHRWIFPSQSPDIHVVTNWFNELGEEW